MTVLTTDNRRSYTGDGSTTVFAFPVFFLDAADVKAALRVNDLETSLVFNVDYTVAGAGNPSGGSVTFTTAPVSGSTVVLFADPPMTQTVDYQDGDEFPAETHEHALDKLTLLVQRLSARVARTLQYDETAPEVLSASDLIGRVTAAETARDQAQTAQAAAATSETNAAASATQAAASAASVNSPALQAAIDAKANASHTHDASDIVSGTIDAARLPPGVAPAGAIFWFGLSSPPTGYLKANGAAVSRTTYAGLFAAIGTTFGVGDGTTTFNVPDLRGEFVRGWDDGRSVDSGRSLGSAQGDNMASHKHASPGAYFGTGLTLYTKNASSPFGGSTTTGDTFTFNPGLTFLTFDLAYPLTNTPEAVSGENRPRNVALLACIKY